MSLLLRNSLNVCRNGLYSLLTSTKQFHIMSGPRIDSPKTTLQNIKFLAPTVIDLIPNCGFKVKGLVRRRCKDCFFVSREERLYVLCKTHPRHKQMSMVKKPRNTWILTHATQGKIRPW
ncbi:hypothetical protein HHI36_021968 [Cryptolaemus montrouzieri]|uniref:Ribosomal protein n=1 Tax=Cryptolaemus montrouzieri TaxID=559131 RepID=A0ABD2MYB2_9CUCU